MNKHIDARTFAANPDQIMDEVARDNAPVTIERDGKPAVVMMSVVDYLRTIPAPDWLQQSWDHARRLGQDKMTMNEIDEEIAAARQEARQPPTPFVDP